MLEELANTNWRELKTSFGQPADDVPIHIRQLLSDSHDERQKAYRTLKSLICNTYILNTATLKTVPFLLELLKSDETQDKQNILWTLQICSQDLEVTYENLSRLSFRRAVRIGRAIATGLETYVTLLNHSNYRVRTAALFLLINGTFPKHDWIRIHQAYEEFKPDEKHPDVIQHFRHLDKLISNVKPLHDITG